MCLLALIFSRILTRPVRALADAVRRVSSGQTGVNVAVNSRDEFGELASAFNDMSASLQTKQQLIEEQRKENDKLLASLMPETVADRYREGESNISTQHRDVSVIYAQLIGFDEFSRSMPSEQSVSMLNALVEAFDDAADRHGVEKVRSMQDNGLLATCGLVVPRVDHSSRTIAFAKELTETVRRFNERNGARLTVRVGIDSGAVTSGLLGSDRRSTRYGVRPSTWPTGCTPPQCPTGFSSATGFIVQSRASTRSAAPAPSPASMAPRRSGGWRPAGAAAMSAVTGQPWFWPALTVVVGLPVALLVLHELHASLVRRGSAYAKPVLLLRNWVFPILPCICWSTNWNTATSTRRGRRSRPRWSASW